MSQHDFILDNATGASFRADLNSALAAGVSLSSGTSAPTTTYAYMWWADTTTGYLKIRNAANDAWITVGKLSNLWDSPTLVTPALGTPAGGDLRNCSLAVAPAIGSTTPSTGAFTTLSAASANAKSLTGFWHTQIFDTTAVAAGVGGGTSFIGYKTGTSAFGLFGAIAGYKANGTAGNELGGTKIYANDSTALVQVGDFSSTGLVVTGTIKGSTTIGVGGATPSASGAGITFPATQSASSDANTLDDYEEGYHTASVTCGTSGTVTLNTAYDTLAYTKIGRKVTVTGNLVVSSVSSPVGYFDISLPFAVADLTKYSEVSVASIFCIFPVSVTLTQFVSRTMGASSVLSVYLGDVAGGSIQSDSAQELRAGSEIYLQLTYFA